MRWQPRCAYWHRCRCVQLVWRDNKWTSLYSGYYDRIYTYSYKFGRLCGAPAWLKISAGGAHSLGIKSDGTLWSWGSNGVAQLGDGTTTLTRNTPAQIGTATNWVAVATGFNFSLGLKS